MTFPQKCIFLVFFLKLKADKAICFGEGDKLKFGEVIVTVGNGKE